MSFSLRKYLTLITLSLFVVFASGCASTGSVDKDPFETANRAILKFNLSSDKHVLAPVARGYKKVLPQPVRNGISNFFSNLWEPMTIVNDLLQGKFKMAGVSTGRFIINTTVGILGFADVATRLDLPHHREDFGQTLAVWGVPSGPYLVLPFLGPSNLRDTGGLIPQFVYADIVALQDSPESLIGGVTRVVDTRSRFLGTEEILELQPDKYLFIREGYRQTRLNQINDGVGTGEDSEDDLLDELLETE